jgi:hypothetical protein
MHTHQSFRVYEPDLLLCFLNCQLSVRVDSSREHVRNADAGFAGAVEEESVVRYLPNTSIVCVLREREGGGRGEREGIYKQIITFVDHRRQLSFHNMIGMNTNQYT